MSKRLRRRARQRIGDLPLDLYEKLKDKPVMSLEEFAEKAKKRIEELEMQNEPPEREEDYRG